MDKKISLMFYFSILIFLNVFDFFNLLNHDFDIFKKFLSWGIIIFIFYNLSISKIFLGVRKKSYDILFLIIFSFLTIPKILFSYILNSDSTNFLIFDFLVLFLKKSIYAFRSYDLKLILFIFSLIFLLLLCINIISTFKFSTKNKLGLINSFNFKNNFFKNIKIFIILFFGLLFFGTIVYNFFIEWFALAIDSFILFFGLIYYGFLFYKEHKLKSNLLSKVSLIGNFGNDIYNKIINFFSSKKTFFIGILFLLSLHLVIDFIVYIFSYLSGIPNSFYFSDLKISENFNPLFNFLNFENSRFYVDYILNPIWFPLILIIYLLQISFFGIVFIYPFYYLYSNYFKKNYNFEKLEYFSLFSFIFIFLNYLLNLSFSKNPMNLILNFQTLNSEISGIFISTNSLFLKSLSFLDILFLFLLIFISGGIIYLLINHKKNFIFIINKFLFFLFFLFYISFFFVNLVSENISSIKEVDISNFNDIKTDITNKKKNLIFNNLKENYLILENKLSNELTLKNQKITFSFYKKNKSNFIVINTLFKSNILISNKKDKYTPITKILNISYNKNSYFDKKLAQTYFDTNSTIVITLNNIFLVDINNKKISNLNKIVGILTKLLRIKEEKITDKIKVNFEIFINFLYVLIYSFFYIGGILYFIFFIFRKIKK
jgi:hypothetical protein